MMARVLFALVVDAGEGLTAAELARHLAVSPASVSRAVRDLEHLGFVRRQVTDRRRSERYALPEHAWERVWAAQAKGVQRWVEEFQRGIDLFDVDHPARARLAEFSLFLDLVQAHMTYVTERMQHQVAVPVIGVAADRSSESRTG
jgi:predicted transcriptional regulator